MPTSTNVQNLKINTLTEAQFDTAVQSGVIGENELSILTDISDSSIQLSELPQPSQAEEGNIYQYIGSTTSNYTNGYFYQCGIQSIPDSLTASQTTGSGLNVTGTDVTAFASMLDPQASGTYTFEVTEITPASASYNVEQGDISFVGPENIDTFLSEYLGENPDAVDYGYFYYVYDSDLQGYVWEVVCGEYADMYVDAETLAVYGFEITGNLAEGDTVFFQRLPEEITWEDGNANVLNPLDCGIFYEGTPVVGDIITAVYTESGSEYVWKAKEVQKDEGLRQLTEMPEPSTMPSQVVQYIGSSTENYTSGYFYESTYTPGTPTATISQTVGNSFSYVHVSRTQFRNACNNTPGTYNFEVTAATPPSTVYTVVQGNFTFSGPADIKQIFTNLPEDFNLEQGRITYIDGTQYGYPYPALWLFSVYDPSDGQYYGLILGLPEQMASSGFEITGEPQYDDYVDYTYTAGSVTWSSTEFGTQSSLSSFGITYTGIPVVGDVLTVVYSLGTPVYSWTAKQVQYTEPGGVTSVNGVTGEVTTNDVLPAQEYQNGKVLMTDGQDVFWGDVSTTPPSVPELIATDWVSNEQTIQVDGVTSYNTVLVGPAPLSSDEYAECGILCTAQGEGELTFTCQTVPQNDLTINVVCF